MPIREIIGPDNPVLRRKARAVDNANTPAVQTLIADMVETMRQAEGVGLAAPQVAVGQRVAVIEFAEIPPDLPPEAEPPAPKLYVIVNPEIVDRSDEMVDGTEGCLSIPGYAGNVLRHKAVTVKGLNRRGKPVKIKARDWLARIFQHEIDHLDGVLFIDRASKVWRLQDAAADREDEPLMRE